MHDVTQCPEYLWALDALHHPTAYDWSFQGFGFVRAYLDEAKAWRLHIWDPAARKPGATLIHNHPWDLRSWIIAGELHNQRYEVSQGDPTHEELLIRPGYDTAVLQPRPPVCLVAKPLEVYRPGDRYEQRWDEIHETSSPGIAVTVVHRDRAGRPDEATVYPELGTPWVDAKPHGITLEEAEPWIDRALTALAR